MPRPVVHSRGYALTVKCQRLARVGVASGNSSANRRSIIQWTGSFGLGACISLLGIADTADCREAGDWSTPGLGSTDDTGAPEFVKTASGALIQDLVRGTGEREACPGDVVLMDYVLRRANGYFIYSTVEGLSFQPRDIPTGPVRWKLDGDELLPGLVEAVSGMRKGGRRRVLIPPRIGYGAGDGLEPKMPTFGTSRQLENHKSEPLIFEVELINIVL
jgi:hypothetical protein